MTNGPMDGITKKIAVRTDGANLSEAGAIFAEETRFCWIDEDGARVSPIHGDFGKALSWISDWPEWNKRIDERDTNLNLSETDIWSERERAAIDKAKARLSLTGKPPKKLRRLVMRTTVESIVEHERLTVDHVMRTIGLDS